MSEANQPSQPAKAGGGRLLTAAIVGLTLIAVLRIYRVQCLEPARGGHPTATHHKHSVRSIHGNGSEHSNGN
jgi:hypothetical protein